MCGNGKEIIGLDRQAAAQEQKHECAAGSFGFLPLDQSGQNRFHYFAPAPLSFENELDQISGAGATEEYK